MSGAITARRKANSAKIDPALFHRSASSVTLTEDVIAAYTRNLWDGTAHFSWPYWDVYAGQDEYINDLKSVAAAYGYTPHDIDVFLGYGLCPEEIEEIMCCGEV